MSLFPLPLSCPPPPLSLSFTTNLFLLHPMSSSFSSPDGFPCLPWAQGYGTVDRAPPRVPACVPPSVCEGLPRHTGHTTLCYDDNAAHGGETPWTICISCYRKRTTCKDMNEETLSELSLYIVFFLYQFEQNLLPGSSSSILSFLK